PALLAADSELKIWIEADPKAGTLSVRDNGIGMSRDEAIAHLGTIARSGTAEFFKQLSGDQQKDAQLIGQFGVGFYSAFIVAERVEVYSRRAGLPPSEGVRWESAAAGDFTVETVELPQRGTRVVLHLKEDAKEFLDPWRLRALVRRYSDHIAFPVLLPKEGEASVEFEVVNQAKALWTRPRTEISDDEYREYYKHLTHDFGEPLAWSHNKVEGKREYTTLLYIPAHAPFDLHHREAARGLKLYVRRVFIMDDAEQFLPLYLRFIKGVVDSSDLPLNVSRELLQKDAEVDAMRSAITKRALDLLGRLAKEEPDKYAICWQEFGTVLKEGLAEDPANRDKLLSLLRFASTHSEDDKALVSLADYVARMREGQPYIYYVIGESVAAARGSPFIEKLRAKGVEVLLLGDRIDEWAMSHVTEFDGKRLRDAARGELELGKLADAADEAAADAALKESKSLLKKIKDTLGDRVSEVRISKRLAESPACLVRGEHEIGAQLRRVMAAVGQKLPADKPVFEVNASHPLLRRLGDTQDKTEFDDLTLYIYEQAQLAEGSQLANPAAHVRRVNNLLARLLR
ncbi:MAG: molecular chaperone HtpG, partial [Steroidobacteraceae bacterium]|nr:molecular chaperone HtpG [Steroidobacteraceae bacterium]